MSPTNITTDDEKYPSSHPPSPTSPTSHSERSSEEENAPLLEDGFSGEPEKITEAAEAYPRKPFISAEYRIALSHFLVCNVSPFLTMALTYCTEDILLLHQE